MSPSPYDPLETASDQPQNDWRMPILAASVICPFACAAGIAFLIMQTQAEVTALAKLIAMALFPLLINQYFIVRYPNLVSQVVMSLGAVAYLTLFVVIYNRYNMRQIGTGALWPLYYAVFGGFCALAAVWITTGIVHRKRKLESVYGDNKVP